MAKSVSHAYNLALEKQKKLEVYDLPEFRILKNNKLKSIKFRKSLILSILFTFTMLMIISYRCNVISEKNLEIQKLENKLTKTKSELASSEIKLDKAVDLDKIEIYSKGELGMQKPEKTQMIYLSVEEQSALKTSTNSSIINKITEYIKGIFN